MRSTQWSLVLRAGRGSAAALDQLCGVYWFPVYAYLRRVGHDTEDAREHTQEFFAGVLRRDDLARVTQEGGRFRDWLFVAVRRHHGRARAKARADKRQRIEVGDPEERLRRLAAPGLDPEQTFQRQWALAVLDAARRRLRDTYVARGDEAVFDALRPGLLGEGRPHREVAEALGLSPGAVRVAAHRLKARYGEALRAEIADTLDDADQVDDELQQLLRALSAPAR